MQRTTLGCDGETIVFPTQHRNGFIVEAAPFVYRVVSRPIALRLLEFFYEVNRHLF